MSTPPTMARVTRAGCGSDAIWATAGPEETAIHSTARIGVRRVIGFSSRETICGYGRARAAGTRPDLSWIRGGRCGTLNGRDLHCCTRPLVLHALFEYV